MDNTEKHFSEEKFWDKLKRYGVKAGHSVVYTALLLYFVLQKPDVPKKSKMVIIGALGYFHPSNGFHSGHGSRGRVYR